MSEEHASWNVKYMPDSFGRPQKISKMSLKQVDNRIKNTKTRLVANKSWLEGLYQRRAVLMEKAGETDYKKKNTNEKIIQHLRLRKDLNTQEAKETYDSKLKAVLMTALDFLERDKPVELVRKVLEQARDEL
tara:strand:+ start:2110 stop:2505 length:396 start_codon:yes stop_codon:yes gene_type:complete